MEGALASSTGIWPAPEDYREKGVRCSVGSNMVPTVREERGPLGRRVPHREDGESRTVGPKSSLAA